MLSVFLYKHRKTLSFLILILISFVMMGFNTSKFTLDLKSILLTVVYPFEFVINGVLNFFKSTWESIGKIEVMRSELAQTRKRLKKLEETSGDVAKLRRENERLRKLLGEKEKITYVHILAGITAKDPQNLYQSLILNKGSSDGVRVSMPVVAYRDGRIGVVGKVSVVTPYACMVSTIREPKFYLGAQLKVSRYYGLVRGRGMSRTCDLEYVDINAPIRLGDHVITSGQSDIFPKGLDIGRVIYIDREKGQFFLQARIMPTINFAQLEDVYIIKKLPSPEVIKLLKGKKQ